ACIAAFPLLPWLTHPTTHTPIQSPSNWFLRALSLLIIACPCALVISTPVAIVAAIGAASRNGALIKGGAYLERLGRVRAILYDKTGTLTHGSFEVDELLLLSGTTRERSLALASALELRSEHPLARAIVAYSGNSGAGISVDAFKAVAGLGARGIVDGTIYSIGSAAMIESLVIDLSGVSDELERIQER